MVQDVLIGLAGAIALYTTAEGHHVIGAFALCLCLMFFNQSMRHR